MTQLRAGRATKQPSLSALLERSAVKAVTAVVLVLLPDDPLSSIMREGGFESAVEAVASSAVQLHIYSVAYHTCSLCAAVIIKVHCYENWATQGECFGQVINTLKSAE